MALTLIPLLLLALAEVGLRVAGFGYPTRFFLETTIGGRSVLVENKQFGWRFFPREMARTPHPLVLEPRKPANTFRVFVFGESAAMGDPEPVFGLSRLLEVLLRERWPGKRVEVVNVAMTAINSHVILPIARECARREGDLWVVYMGNNEVIGPFGAGTVFGSQVPSRGVIRASLALKSLRLGQALGEVGRWREPRDRPRSWEGMEMFLSQQVGVEDPRLKIVYGHFRANLEEIIDLGVGSGARVVVSTVASNLKDCPPFGSAHPRGWSADRQAAWEKLFQEGVGLESDRRWSEAVAVYQKGLELDGHYAELQFRLGRCLGELQRPEEAASYYRSARDNDTLRFRADAEENRVVREVCQRRAAEKVVLVEAEESLGRAGAGPVAGDELFFEHVHFNFQGNYLLAMGLVRQIAPLLPEGRSRTNWLSAGECAERLAYSAWNELAIAKEIRRRLQSPPFTGQLDHTAREQAWAKKVADLQAQVTPELLQRALRENREAVARAEDDWMLHDNLGKLLEAVGDQVGALAEWRTVAARMPHYPTVHFEIGNSLDIVGKSAEAQPYLETAVRLKPNFVGAINGLGLALAAQGRPEEAFRQYARALEIKPDFAAAHVNWGLGLASKQRLAEAREHFAEALKINPNNPFALFNLGNILVAQRQDAEAASRFARAAELNPDFVQARLGLARALVRLGRASEAQPQWREVVRRQPNLAEAHLNLGLTLLGESKTAEATRHFQEVLRLDPTNSVAREHLARLAPGGRKSP